MDNIQRLISEQVLTWAKRESKFRQKKEDPTSWPVITISREYGAGGSSLANNVSDRTGFKVWDRELLTAITEVTGADEKFLASLDERRRTLVEDTLYGTLMGFKQSNTNYFRSLLRIVQTIGAHGRSIIIGRGSNYILDDESALKIRVVCPIRQRIANVVHQQDISQKEAEKLLKARDKERADFVQYYFKHDVSSPEDYDLVLNSGRFSMDKMAELLLQAYEIKVGKTIPQQV